MEKVERVEIEKEEKQRNLEKKYLHIIGMLAQVIFVFFTVFFSIYVYEISKNLNFVLFYMLFNVTIRLLCEVVIYQFANNKVLKILYKLSFVLCLISILLIFLIKSNTLYMVFVAQFFYAIALTFYYVPNEIATMDKNSKKQMGKFIGIDAVLALFAQILSPFLSGVIVSYVSYYILFAIISIVALTCFILSFKVQKHCEVDKRIKLKYFIKDVHGYKGIKLGYLGYGIFKFSQDGVIDVILPVLIFIRTGGSFSVGLYSALATLIAGGVLIIYLYFCKNKAIALYIATTFLVIVSILIIFFNSLTMFFVYYFIKKSVFEVLKTGIFESVFNLPKGTKMEEYKIEQHMTFSLYNRIFVILAFIFSLLIYNFIKSDLTISIILLVLSASQIISTILTVKSDKLREQNL